MHKNYIDTLSMFCNLGTPINNNPLSKPWKYNNSNPDSNLHYWFNKTDKLFIAYYPNMYGQAKLYVTTSIPKYLIGSNVYNITNFDENTFFESIMSELQIFPWSNYSTIPMPKSFFYWQASRIDLFIMHPINPDERDEIESTYKLLTLSKFRTVKYGHTTYINSSARPDKKSNKVIAIYPKITEVNDRLKNKQDELPLAVRKQHELFLETSDIKRELFRFEFRFSRPCIRYECNKKNVFPNVHEVLKQEFQEELITNMVKAVGLNRKILSKKNYRKQVQQIFPTKKTRQNALTLARCIRNQQRVPLSYNQTYRIKKELMAAGLHFITNGYIDIEEIKLPLS